jgi:hypothetical protein
MKVIYREYIIVYEPLSYVPKEFHWAYKCERENDRVLTLVDESEQLE